MSRGSKAAKYHTKAIDTINGYRYDKVTKTTYLTLKIKSGKRKITKEIDTSNDTLIHHSTLNSAKLVKFYKSVNGAKSFPEFELKLSTEGAQRHHCISIPINIDNDYQHTISINTQCVENNEKPITLQQITETCERSNMFPNELLDDIHRMDHEDEDGNQINLPNKCIPIRLIKYESGTKIKKRGRKKKKLLRPHKKGNVNKILLRTTPFCTENGLLLAKKNKSKKAHTDDTIQTQIDEMTLPRMSQLEAAQSINNNKNEFEDEENVTEDEENEIDDEASQFDKDLEQYRQSLSKPPTQPMQNNSVPNGMIQMPAQMLQQMLDNHGRMITLFQNQLSSNQMNNNNNNKNVTTQRNNQSIQMNKLNHNNCQKPNKPNKSNKNVSGDTEGWPKGIMRRKIMIFKLLNDKKSKLSIAHRAKQLNPPLILTPSELHDVKLFFKFCNNSNIVIDEESMEFWTMQKFRKEIIDGSAVAKRYKVAFKLDLTVARGIRWKDHVGSIKNWIPPQNLVTLIEKNETETNSNDMSIDE